jgi:hypothetical protein
MQSWVKISRPAGAVGGAPNCVPPESGLEARPRAANEDGNGDQADCDDNRFQLGGRSRVIHAFLVGF